MGIIISAFAGVGKSYLGKKYNTILDLESTHYKWLDDGEFLEDALIKGGYIK